ncbi:MAG: glycerophosphodiester phosphodiesterase [Eubacteriales bacterium]|jgi:glycerophosphoryl diester phosphodiesterase|nr:glycerophosphodiester phosphodiesterase [Eubacteriales bacterium]MDD3109013.1 glycerophosphodiester phosphodiesterase [Eubacteriales bacterium]MDD3572619.1 glycerophosphodiester phosphodiesterase [Eubacteriales bacterium]MDD4133627.1 glycerophosphodiester phosphodiesterase [Eubacteriales bacterium]NLO13683.1 glycerophosphodiester phosphodiesterase [Clostridiales bacterium]
MRTLVCAHRGASGYAPENTLEAFQLAVEQGADAVELDVQLTRDKQLIVAHDERIDRVSDGSGLISMLSLKDIKSHLFNATHPAYLDSRAPTLEEVFDLLMATGLVINVELKNSRIPYAGMEEKCIELARRKGMSKRVIYSSFNHHSLVKVKTIDPDAACGLLYDCCMVEPWVYADHLGIEALHPHYSELLLNPRECGEAHKAGLKVNAWTVNDDRDMKKVFELQADMLITNYPDRALVVRDV